MSERFFRIVLGSVLIAFLALNIEMLIYGYIALLLFEGLTNLRVPILVSKLRYGADLVSSSLPQDKTKLPVEAERVLRILVALFLIISYVFFPETLWFFPWFVGFMLFMAGVTNICPMVMSLKWLGFR